MKLMFQVTYEVLKNNWQIDSVTLKSAKRNEINAFCFFFLQQTVNTCTFSYAISVGWTASVLIQYDSDNSPLPSGRVPLEQLAWVSSIFGIGGVIGTVFIGWFADVIGRKNSLIAMTVPQLVSK